MTRTSIEREVQAMGCGYRAHVDGRMDKAETESLSVTKCSEMYLATGLLVHPAVSLIVVTRAYAMKKKKDLKGFERPQNSQ